MKRLFLSLIILFTLTNCADKQEVKQPQTKQENKVSKEDKYTYVTIAPDSMLVAVIQTKLGAIELELFPNETPKTVTNFVTLAEENFYDSVIFHRVVPGFVIQGGDPTGTGSDSQTRASVTSTVKFTVLVAPWAAPKVPSPTYVPSVNSPTWKPLTYSL